MFSDFYHTFYYLLLFTGVLVSILLFNRLESPFKWLAILLILTLVSESIAKYISSSLGKPNNIVYHIFTIIEYILYAVIYSQLFRNSGWRRILIISVFILITAEIINVLFFQPLYVDNTNTMILESIFLIIISLSLFNKIRADMEYNNILQEGIFWFNSAVLFYYSFDILIWGFHSIKVYRLENPPTLVYSINLLISGFLYLFYTIAIFLNFYFHRNYKNPA
jgi:hypothetical protein